MLRLPRPSSLRRCRAEPLMRFAMGPFDVALAGRMHRALDDFASLYADRRLDDLPVDRIDPARTIRLDVTRDWSLVPGSRWQIQADEERIYHRRPSCEVLPYLEWAINWRTVARLDDHLALHAAALARHGRGVVFASVSGGGKSTLSAALVQRGWSYFCDELALIEPDQLLLRPMPKAICVKQGSFAMVRRLGLPLRLTGNYVKAFKGSVAYINPTEAGGRIAPAPLPIAAIFFIERYSPAPPCITPIAGAAAALDAAALTFHRHHRNDGALGLIARLIRTTPCFRLRSGPLLDTCGAIEQCIDELPLTRTRSIEVPTPTRGAA